MDSAAVVQASVNRLVPVGASVDSLMKIEVRASLGVTVWKEDN